MSEAAVQRPESTLLLCGGAAVVAAAVWIWKKRAPCDEDRYAVLECIRNRRSVWPANYDKDPSRAPVDPAVVRSLLDAALWGPFHGANYAGHEHPARFVVLGRRAMREMQALTLAYYDRHWREVREECTEEAYRAWRHRTAEEIDGRWGPCSYMIAIVARRKSGPKTVLPEWEEAAATAAAVENMHIQSTRFPELACYWSSWHAAARDSREMKDFLGMAAEDRCMGFFMVAQKAPAFAEAKGRRQRDRALMQVEWRTD